MNHFSKLGLGNAVDSETVIFHGGIIDHDSFGRVADLVGLWFRREHQLPPKGVSDLKILTQALLQFGSSGSKTAPPGRLEVAIEKGHVYLSFRFENSIVEEDESPEKNLSKHWLNSEEAALVKKIMQPLDRVEVRFSKEMNLLEWRIIRALSDENHSLEALAFQVFSVVGNEISVDHENFTEMGDIDYEEWIASVYRKERRRSASDSVLSADQTDVLEESWNQRVKRDPQFSDETTKTFSNSSDDFNHERNQTILVRNSQITENEDRTFVGESYVDTDAIEATDVDLHSEKKIEFKNASKSDIDRSEVSLSVSESEKDRIQESDLFGQIESDGSTSTLLISEEVFVNAPERKAVEKLGVLADSRSDSDTVIKEKMQLEIRSLQEKIHALETSRQSTEGKQAKLFREKASQMFEMVRKLQVEKRQVEKELRESRKTQPVSGEMISIDENDAASGSRVVADESPGLLLQIEELNKKSDRLNRALESEKNKVKGLLDRALAAEREAQSSTPMIADLEQKAENALKMIQQHKKETESVKQKLVQSDAEKNKIKNDLLKAQAQIQTMMKRQAG